MSIRNTLFVTAFVFATLGAAHADGLRPIEAKSIDLGEFSGVAYYTVERNGFQVVIRHDRDEDSAPKTQWGRHG